MAPFYDLYPKDPVENLKWRIRCRERALVDLRFRHALYDACMLDPLFWMAFACWSFEPRAKIKIRPFIPWPHQESVFVKIDAAVDRAEAEEISIDVIVDKARAQGGTFGYLWIDLRRWLRDPMFSAGYVTRNESLVDSKTDSDTLFWKIDWAINRLPFWLVPAGFDWKQHRSYTNHSLLNPANGASLVGYAAGQDVGTGGRKTVFTIDEAGARDFVSGEKDAAIQESLHDVTNCLAAGTLVVTDRGPIPIEDVVDELVWDGKMWVRHEGVVSRGERETIDAYGLRLTPDHKVLTVEGWAYASARLDRQDVRLPDGYRKVWVKQKRQRDMALPLRLRCREDCDRSKAYSGRHAALRLRQGGQHFQVDHDARNDRDADLLQLGCDGQSGYESESSSLQRLWGEGDHGLQTVAQVQELSGRHGAEAGRNDPGAHRQRRAVHTEELPVGDSERAGEQSEVFDLVNCGPRSRFTVLGRDGRPVIVHNCLRMVSARYVDQGVFHEACENPDTSKNSVYLILDWKDNPLHGKHAYVVTDGKATARRPEDQPAVDKYHAENQDLRARLERKGFKFEGRVRSPWYDMRCLRPTSTPRLIASQLDRDPRGAVGKCFTSDLLDRMKRDKCKKPVWQGQPVFDSETMKLRGLIPRDDGPLKLWFKPGLDHSPPLGPFTVGCDMAAGSDGAYSSNSVASILDDRTGEQVGEYAIKGMPLIKFGRVVVGLCLWLRNATLGWEDSGMAGPFAKEIMEVLYYGNVYYREVPEIGSRKKSRKAGWPCRNVEDKAELFEKMALAMEMGTYTPRSEDLIRECGEYEWEKGKIIHAPTKNRGAVETNHGDRCIAASGCWLVFTSDEQPGKLDTNEETGETPEYGSFLWRERQEQRMASAGSPAFGIRDVLAY